MLHYTRVLLMLLIVSCTVLAVMTSSLANDETTAAADKQLTPKHTPPHRQRTLYNHHHNHNHNQNQNQNHNNRQRQHQHPHRHHQQQQPQQQQAHRQHQQRVSTLKSDVELLPGVTMPPAQRKNATESTRLRRVSSAARNNYYNNMNTRSLSGHRPSEWDYNTYNVYTNTYGPPPPPVHDSGKGDDNMHDVEFIGASTGATGSSSGGRGYDYVPPMAPAATTQTPTVYHRRHVPTVGPIPPLVPARRGYANVAPRRSENDLPQTTDNPYETNTISRNSPTDPKEMERRHICVQQRTITMPVKTTEVYTRPTWKHINTPCQPPTHANQMCTRVQLVHEQAYRDVIRHKSSQQLTYDCCTGWTRESLHADACMKPICAARCQNGGSCTGPEQCNCPAGFTGRYCEQDINECKLEKPCDQTCLNTVGSFYCKCREGFVLQPDQQSCKKTDPKVDDAFEARDLENDIDTGDEVDARLQKIERSLANERVHTNELQKSLQATYNVVDTLKSRLVTLEKQHMDFNRLQTNLYNTENRTNKLEGMLNLLIKCRNGPNANCP